MREPNFNLKSEWLPTAIVLKAPVAVPQQGDLVASVCWRCQSPKAIKIRKHEFVFKIGDPKKWLFSFRCLETSLKNAQYAMGVSQEAAGPV